MLNQIPLFEAEEIYNRRGKKEKILNRYYHVGLYQF